MNVTNALEALAEVRLRFSSRKFLFRCEDCLMILSVDFEDEEEHGKVHDNEVTMECLCGACCRVLRD